MPTEYVCSASKFGFLAELQSGLVDLNSCLLSSSVLYRCLHFTGLVNICFTGLWSQKKKISVPWEKKITSNLLLEALEKQGTECYMHFRCIFVFAPLTKIAVHVPCL